MKAGSFKSIRQGKTKWKFGKAKVYLTEPFCILGQINKTYVCWINPRQIEGRNRVHCDFMLFLKSLGDTSNFASEMLDDTATEVLDKFQFINQVQIDLYHNSGGNAHNKHNGCGMPDHYNTSFPRFSLSIDKWPHPTKCVWMMSGVSINRHCSTPKCGFKAQQLCDHRKHESRCKAEIVVSPKSITYGWGFNHNLT